MDSSMVPVTMMLNPSDEKDDDIEFLEFQQELESESRLSSMNNNRDVDSLAVHPDPPLSAIISSSSDDDDNSSSNENVFDDIIDNDTDDHHEMDVGIDLDLDDDHESSSSSSKHSAIIRKEEEEVLSKTTTKQEAAVTTPRTMASTKVVDDDHSANAPRDETNKNRSRRKKKKEIPKDIPKDISIQDNTNSDAATTTTTRHQKLLLLDQQIVVEQFGVYSDLSGEEDDEDDSRNNLCCLQDAAVVALEAATARMMQECQHPSKGNNETKDASSEEGIRGPFQCYCPNNNNNNNDAECCGRDHDGHGAIQNCYEGLQLFANEEEDDRDQGRVVSDKEESNNISGTITKKEEDEHPNDVHDNPKPDSSMVSHPQDGGGEDPEAEEEEEGIESMHDDDDDDEHQFAINRSFSSFTQQPGTFCQDHCDVMSQYWERIKLALVTSYNNRNTNGGGGGGDYSLYQAIDAKSPAADSFLSSSSCLDHHGTAHHQNQQRPLLLLEQEDSLSYSSMDDDGTFPSPFFPVLEKSYCRRDNGVLLLDDASFANNNNHNEMDKMISCALPNGLIFCTIWLDHPDYLQQVLLDGGHIVDMTSNVKESDFTIRNGCEIVWQIGISKRLVEFPHHANTTTTQASDLLRCFSWAGDKDHAVVYQLNQVLGEMRRATEKNCLEEINIEAAPAESVPPETMALSDDSIEEEEEDHETMEIVLWTSPKRIFPHFVNVHGNHVSTVHLVRETNGSNSNSTLGRYACGGGNNYSVMDKSFAAAAVGRIVFFVKTLDSIPSLMSAPSDEMEQGEETILLEEESVVDDDDEKDEEEEVCPHDEEEWLATEEDPCPQDEDEHHNEEWSVAGRSNMTGRSNVTTMIDNRTRPQRIRYILNDETDEEFSERFGL